MPRHAPPPKTPRATPAPSGDDARPPDDVQDVTDPRALPHGSTTDQIANMENEGQAQPQADELEDGEAPPDEPPSR